MREIIAQALKDAIKAQDKRRISTLRLIQAAIQDRDIAHRGAGKDPVSDEEIMQILAKEIAIIQGFLPRQLGEDDVKQACQQVIDEVGADGLRDMGRCMAALKERFAGQMDFGKASSIVKTMLQ